jgi:hypothetical protein
MEAYIFKLWQPRGSNQEYLVDKLKIKLNLEIFSSLREIIKIEKTSIAGFCPELITIKFIQKILHP